MPAEDTVDARGWGDSRTASQIIGAARAAVRA
jgi:hypothetical protein